MRKLLIILLLTIWCGHCAAQGSDSQPSGLVPTSPTEGMSPNAHSYQRYGDIPVSLYTGTPDISIPLGAIKEGALSLPISLSYHSGSIKADEHPGWVGLGWTLIAGGCITREVRDIPDEIKDWGYKTAYKSAGLHKVLSPSFDISGIYSDIVAGSIYEALDTEPDKFNFNFPGCSGFFMLDTLGKWMVCCDHPVKIEAAAPEAPNITFKNGSKTYQSSAAYIFPKFIITAEDGVQYTFGGNDAIELSINSGNQLSDEWEATAWHLSEIKHPNGDKITFTYERGDFVVNFSNNSTNVWVAGTSYANLGAYSGRLVSPVYLKKIATPFSQITFATSESTELNYSGKAYGDRSTVIDASVNNTTRTVYCPRSGRSMMDEVRWRQLDKIEMRHSRSGNFRSITFNYSSSADQRLTLLGLEISGFEDAVCEKYVFQYNNIAAMPEYLSGLTDHWGYYCGSTTRSTDREKTLYGTLTEITYPTGGKTIFEFEPNYYKQILHNSNVLNESGLAGGARIRRIVNVPADGTDPELRTFAYVNGYSPKTDIEKCPGSGVLEGKPVYRANLEYVSNGYIFTVSQESNQSLTTLTNNSGFHISYPTVYEIREDGSYTMHDFIFPNFPGLRDEPPLKASNSQAFVPHSLKGHYRGKPSAITHYDNRGKCVMSEYFSYDIIGTLEQWVPSLSFCSCEIRNMSNSHAAPTVYLTYSLYKNYMHSYALASHTVTQFSRSGAPAQTVFNYKKYTKEGQLRSDSTVTTVSNNNLDEILHRSVTTYKYQWESDSWYASHHIKNLVRDVTHSINGKMVNHYLNTYQIYGSKFPVLLSVKNLFDGSCERLLYESGRSDSKGRPIQVRNADALYTVYLWGADGMYPVAEIKNADAARVREVLGYDPADAPSDTNILQNLEKLRKELTEAFVTTYTYIPYLGITSITDPAGITTYYGYDNQARLTKIWDSWENLVKRYYYETYSGASTDYYFNPITNAR